MGRREGHIVEVGPLLEVVAMGCVFDEHSLSEHVRVPARALLDTGMGWAMITSSLVRQLDLKVRAMVPFGGASFYGGTRTLPVVCVRIELDADAAWNVPAGVVADLGPAGADLCLGQVFLRQLRFFQNGPAGRFSLEW